jgi:hypothetical protein
MIGHRRAEPGPSLERHVRKAPRALGEGPSHGWVEEAALELAESSGDFLPTRGSERCSVLSNLHREIDERDDDGQSTDELAEVRERLKNDRSPDALQAVSAVGLRAYG